MNTSVLLNTEATFSCTFNPEVDSEVIITWSGPDSLPSPVNSEENGLITSNLVINVTDGRYQFELYSCSVSYVHCSMVVTSDPVTFSIIQPPMITEPPIGGDFDINSPLSLTCSATNYGTVTFTWTGPGPYIQETDLLVDNTYIRNNYSIMLSNHSLGGTYTCKVTNEAGSDNASAIIFIRPVVLPEIVVATIGDEVILTCQVQTYPSSIIRWEKKKLTGLFDTINGSGKKLTFMPFTFEDEGVYRCVAAVDGEPDKISTTVAHITFGKCNELIL